MFHPPNPDLIAALRRLPDPALDEGRIAEHRHSLRLARRAERAARRSRLRQVWALWQRRPVLPHLTQATPATGG